MTCFTQKAEVNEKLIDLLGELTPRDNEKRVQFERRVAAALRNEFEARLNVEFLKARWLKNVIQDHFQKCKVITKIHYDKLI